MHPEIAAVMARQNGLITRNQALSRGQTADVVDRLVRCGEWTAVRRGVYAESRLVLAARSHEERRLLADRAASLRIRAPHAMSHDSAALELGMQVLRARTPLTHVTRPGVVGSHLRHGVKHHLAPYGVDDLTTVQGRLVLGPARTAIDIAREHGNPAGVVAVDDARRSGVSIAELERVVAAMRSWPHVTRARTAIELSDTDADSLGETLARLLVRELGHGCPQSQFGLTCDGRTAWADLRLHRHLFEFDGEVKYLRIDEGGFALRDPREILWEEKLRQDWLTGFGLGMSRVVWDDLFGSARERAKARLLREYLATCQRWGTSIDDLTPYLARGPRPRPGSLRRSA